MNKLNDLLKKLWNYLKYTGLWIPPPLSLFVYYALKTVNPRIDEDIYYVILVFCLILPIHIWSKNLVAKSNGYMEFPLFPLNTDTDPRYQTSGRKKAMDKPPSEKLICEKPEGIVFGRALGKYACIIPGKEGASHTLVIGGSGSGKTSTVLADSLLAQYLPKKRDIADITWIVVDVKGELEEKFFFPDERLKVFNPRDKSKCGFDFLYDISDESTEYEVLTAIRRVVYSLIPSQKSQSDSFWTEAPRNVSMGLMLYGWLEEGLRTLPELVDFVLSKDLATLISDVLEDTEPNSIISKLLISFGGDDTADETLSSIAMNIGNAFQLIATDETLRYLLGDCKDKITPLIVEEGTSIDIQISDEFLNVYAKILSLAIGTCNNAMTRRKEGSSPVIMVLDELGRIAHEGQIEGLQEVLQIGRSRGVSVICCLQSWAAMEAVYPEGACKDMLNNLSYRLILQSTPDSKETNEMVIKAFGKYTEKKKSISTGKQKSYTYSYEEKDIIESVDLLILPDMNKCILLSPYGAYMLNKCQYFKDKNLKRIAEDIRKSRADISENE